MELKLKKYATKLMYSLTIIYVFAGEMFKKMFREFKVFRLIRQSFLLLVPKKIF